MKPSVVALALLSSLIPSAVFANSCELPPILNEGADRVVDIAVDFDQKCVLQPTQLYCWKRVRESFDGPNTPAVGLISGLKDARQVVMMGDGACVLDAEGVKCFGGQDVPQFSGLARPTRLSDGYGSIENFAPGMRPDYCAWHESGVQCSGGGILTRMTPAPSFRGLKSLALAPGAACALDASGVRCWSFWEMERIPADLGEVKELAAVRGAVCALNTAGKVKCWGAKSGSYSAVAAKLTDVRLFVRGAGGYFCASHGAIGPTGEETVRCWGSDGDSIRLVPKQYKGLKKLAVDTMNGCALDSTGLQCWGHGSFWHTPDMIQPCNLFPKK